MHLFPAIDIRSGQAVRLTQGDFARAKVYDTDPVQVALRFRKQGAANLHVVDLDGALNGALANFATIRKIVETCGLSVQVGGGIRDEDRVKSYLELGVARVILGTVAAEDFGFVERMVAAHGDKIAVGVDAKAGKVAVRGWREESALDALDFCRRLDRAGVSTIIYTDIAKDGMLGGVNMDAYRTLGQSINCNVIASGGVGGEDDIAALRELNIWGAIVGKALYEGKVQLPALLSLC